MPRIKIEPHHQDFIFDMNEVLEKHFERVEIDELIAIGVQMLAKSVLVAANRKNMGVDVEALVETIKGNFRMAMEDEGVFPKH